MRFVDKLLSSNPGRNWCFAFDKNSFKNKQLRFVTSDWSTCSDESVSLKTTSSLFNSLLYEVIPTKPLTHPVKENSVFPV